MKKSGARIEVINEVLADFTMGGVSSSIPIKEVPERNIILPGLFHY